MSYFHKPLSGLGGVENCGADQVWDPNIEFYGIKGQCRPRKDYRPDQLENPNAIPGVVKTTGATTATGSKVADFFKALVAPTPTAPAPGQPIYLPAPSSGISTKTLAIGGAAALLILYLATRK